METTQTPTTNDLALTYARHTRNATVFIAWAVALFMVASIILGIVVAIDLNQIAAPIQQSSSIYP